jgi:hypothetical protein
MAYVVLLLAEDGTITLIGNRRSEPFASESGAMYRASLVRHVPGRFVAVHKIQQGEPPVSEPVEPEKAPVKEPAPVTRRAPKPRVRVELSEADLPAGRLIRDRSGIARWVVD